MPRMLGDAFVVISPDTRAFRASADRQIKQALAGLKYTVPLGVDVEGTVNAIRALQQRIRQLGLADFLDINIPVGRLITQIQIIRRLLNQAGVADILEVNLDRASLARALAQIGKLPAALVPVNFDLGKLPVLAPLMPLTAKVDLGGLDAALAKAAAEASVLNTLAAELGGNLTLAGRDAGGLAGDIAGLNKMFAVFAESEKVVADAAALQTEMFAKEAAAARLAGAAFTDLDGGTGGGGGGLAGLIAGFAAGGAGARLFGGILGGTFGGIAIWHIALDAAIEALISVGLASAAAATGIAAMAPAAHNISDQLQSVYTVSSALGQAIPPLTGNFQSLAKAMAPQVIEAYGGLLNVVSGGMGQLGGTARTVVNIFDTWIAKIDLWAKSQSGLGGILHTGTGYLQQFGSILADLGIALANLLKSDPGIARFLLDIIGGFAKLLDFATRVAPGLVEVTLAIHGLWIWGRVLGGVLVAVGTGLVNMARGLASVIGPMTGLSAASGNMAKTFLGISAVSWAWAAVAAAAIAGIVYESNQADTATKKFISGLESGLSGISAANQIVVLSADIGQLTTQLQTVTVGNYLPKMSQQLNSWGLHIQATSDALHGIGINFADFFKSIGSWGSASNPLAAAAHSAGLLGHALLSIFSPAAAAAPVAVANNIKALNAEMNKLEGAQANLFGETGHLIAQGFTYTQALSLMDLAGVQWNDSAAVMAQKVDNLIKGYETLSIQGGILANSVDAVTFATLQQDSKVADLNSAWTTFIGTVTGGTTTFTQFQQQIYTTSQDLSGIAPAASKGSASIGGLNTASLQARDAFAQAVVQASAMVNALTLEASASGLGAKGTDMLTAAVKDAVAELLPMAGTSKDAQAALIALAQQGGAPAGISFQQLSGWVNMASGSMTASGKAGGPAAQLNSILGTLAITSSNLKDDVQNLSTALGTTLNDAMATAIFDASGGQKTFDAFARAIMTTGVNSTQTRGAALNLAEGLYNLTGSTRNSYNEFMAFAERALGLTKSQAETLWKQTLPGLQGFIDRMHGTTVSVNVDVYGEGELSISAPGMAAQVIALHARQMPTFAAGGKITGGTGPTSDDVLAMVSKGETVVSAADSQRLAPFFAAMGVPGYQSGGLIGGLGAIPGLVSRGTTLDVASLTGQDTAAVIDSMIAAIQKKAAAIAAGGGSAAPGVITVAKYVMSHGGTRASAAGVGGVVAGESGGQPDIMQIGGGGGAGILQWTPMSSAFPIQPIITGNIGRDMAVQLVDMMAYIASRGGIGDLNAAGAAGGPLAAAELFSAYEAPAVPGSDVRPAVVEQLYAMGLRHGGKVMDSGGWLAPGWNPPMYNGTGTAEPVGPAAAGGGGAQTIQLEITADTGSGTFDAFLTTWLKNNVRIKGGGVVQKAFGRSHLAMK